MGSDFEGKGLDGLRTLRLRFRWVSSSGAEQLGAAVDLTGKSSGDWHGNS